MLLHHIITHGLNCICHPRKWVKWANTQLIHARLYIRIYIHIYTNGKTGEGEALEPAGTDLPERLSEGPLGEVSRKEAFPREGWLRRGEAAGSHGREGDFHEGHPPREESASPRGGSGIAERDVPLRRNQHCPKLPCLPRETAAARELQVLSERTCAVEEEAATRLGLPGESPAMAAESQAALSERTAAMATESRMALSARMRPRDREIAEMRALQGSSSKELQPSPRGLLLLLRAFRLFPRGTPSRAFLSERNRSSPRGFLHCRER